jgi:tetratricopeptide (TPR) repeat protein
MPPKDVKAQLEKILASDLFTKAPRLSRFLRLIVEKVLAGERDIKEYVIGSEISEHGQSYDPKSHNSVRVQACQLRAKLAEYYRVQGQSDAVVIELPKGTYVPAFRLQDAGSMVSTLVVTPRNPQAEPQSIEGPAVAAAEKVQNKSPRPARHPLFLFGPAGLVTGLALLIALSVGAIYYRRAHKPKTVATQAEAPASIHLRPSVAVLGFENLCGTNGKDRLADALGTMVATEIGASGEIRIVPDADVARAKAAALPAGTVAVSRDALTQFRSRLAADYVVYGSCTQVGRSGGQLRLDLRLQDTATGEIRAAQSESGAQAALFRVAERAGSVLRRALGQKVSPGEEAEAAALLPSTAQAARYYAAGLRELEGENGVVASELLQQVVKIEPRFALGHYQLSGAWGFLGYGPRAHAEAKKAFDLSGQLDATTRLLIEANYRDSNHDWNKAKAVRRALFSAYPDALQNGEELAWDLIHTGNEPEALSVLDQLRRLPLALADDPGIDQAEAFARASMSDNEKARAACVRGEQKAHSRGLRLLEARLRSLEGGILGQIGRGVESRTVSLEAAAVCKREGDRACVMEIERRLGNMEVITDTPNPAEAIKHFKRALAVAREIGDSGEVNFDLIGIATADWTAGRLGAARQSFDELLVATRKDDPAGSQLAGVELNYGGMLTLEGDLAPAIKMLREAVAIERKRSERGALAGALQNLAEAERRQGDLQVAERDYRESIDLYRAVAPEGTTGAELGLSDVLWDEGDLAAMRATVNKAEADGQASLNKGVDSGDAKANITEGHVRLARAAFAERDFASAETGAREGLGLADKQPEEAVEAGILLGEALEARGKHQEALAALTTALRILARMPYPYYRLEELIAQARVASGTSGRPGPGGRIEEARLSAGRGEPVRDLDSIITQAHRSGMLGIELRAKLALGEIELRSGDRPAGHIRLSDVQRDAQTRGFRLLASQAEHDLQPQLAMGQVR